MPATMIKYCGEFVAVVRSVSGIFQSIIVNTSSTDTNCPNKRYIIIYKILIKYQFQYWIVSLLVVHQIECFWVEMKDESFTFQLMQKSFKTMEMMQFYIRIEYIYVKYILPESDYYHYCCFVACYCCGSIYITWQGNKNEKNQELKTRKRANNETQTVVVAVNVVVDV